MKPHSKPQSAAFCCCTACAWRLRSTLSVRTILRVRGYRTLVTNCVCSARFTARLRSHYARSLCWHGLAGHCKAGWAGLARFGSRWIVFTLEVDLTYSLQCNLANLVTLKTAWSGRWLPSEIHAAYTLMHVMFAIYCTNSGRNEVPKVQYLKKKQAADTCMNSSCHESKHAKQSSRCLKACRELMLVATL